MNQDDVYTADIARGDNEGRFKLVINKNNVSIEDVANVEEIKFYNNNRQITISGGNIKLVQVYNTLGQRCMRPSNAHSPLMKWRRELTL
ncbi:MAG: hypothetical protein MR963_05040 [Bacteroidales bacterium]|nr:hypothetical protein [Bacteroidales bacterium]